MSAHTIGRVLEEDAYTTRHKSTTTSSLSSSSSSSSALTLAIQDGEAAGQTVPHVHIHLIPRNNGDIPDNDAIYDMIDASGITCQEAEDMAMAVNRAKTGGIALDPQAAGSLGNAPPSPLSAQLVRGKPIGDLVGTAVSGSVTASTQIPATASSAAAAGGGPQRPLPESERKVRTPEDMAREASRYRALMPPPRQPEPAVVVVVVGEGAQ
jgi:hypothetical protein